ncbi:54S ribosomal protein L4, mitochondrial [Talaromyces islandicus]|uniref:Large ribosomal subunit protein uL29m n=1 Tax=Talaromyces islandicus TaxID=28573 RepID=A0A0U1LTU2_TALIS|nr:54S ribosomal protein L4, mitochondrial [Talaromyces islandicus]
MNRQFIGQLVNQSKPSLLAGLPPPYLAPAWHSNHVSSATTQHATFSSTASNAARRGPDKSKSRGVSAIHMTGPKHKLSAAKYPLPAPVPASELPARKSDPNHGLWAFFPPNRQSLSTPEYDSTHGRPWSIQELRGKSWDDLHCLWWVCAKERNRLATSDLERDRLKAGFGEAESAERARVIRTTQKSIKHVLRERWYAWEDARELFDANKQAILNNTDPEIKTSRLVKRVRRQNSKKN